MDGLYGNMHGGGLSSFIKNTACPRCRKQGKDRHGDNLALYSDGGMWCWSCGYGKKGMAMRPQEPLEQPLEAFSRWTRVLPSHHVQNLLERGFKPSELTEFMYDSVWDRRIYPVYSGKELVFYEARSLDKHPKAIQKGEKPIHVLGSGERLVLVEDLLSAIKVARHTKAMPLWGSNLHKDWMPYFIGMRCPIDVWLDANKYRHALTISNSFKLVGVDSNVIKTEADPKDLTDEQIVNELHKLQRTV